MQRYIIIEKELDQNLCIKIEELKLLFDYYKPFDPRRIAWMIMATIGLRPSEVCGGYDDRGEIMGLTYKNILNDFSYIRYKVRKPVTRYYSSTDTVVRTYKVRTRQIMYNTLKYELKQYCLKNYQTFRDGKIFPFQQEEFKRELKKIRMQIKEGKLTDPAWKSFLDEPSTYVWAENNEKFRQQYRITPYSCRRFYNTYKLWAEYGGNIILSARDLGHTHIDTNLIYSYSPDKIGLDMEEKDKVKLTFDHLFNQNHRGQMALTEW